MLRNFDQPVRDMDGVEVTQDGKTFPIGKSIAGAVKSDYEDEKNISFDEKLKRCQLADRIAVGGNIELSDAEIAQIRLLAAKGLKTFVIGQIAPLLETPVASE